MGVVIQFKAKTSNNIFLILTLAFTPYVTRPYILAVSPNFYKNPNVLNISLKLCINDQNFDVMNDQ